MWQQQMLTCTVPPSPARAGTPQHFSQLSAPLFTEDRYSTGIDKDQEACDSEVNNITRTRTPSQATTLVMTPQRPTSTPAMVHYSTQGDPDQEPPQNNDFMSQSTNLQNTNNLFIPDATSRHIHDIHNKTFHQGLLENGHNAYLVELLDLKPLLYTSRYLMDGTTGQFSAVYGNSYQCMCTIPRLLHTWEPGQLMDEIATKQHTFGYMGPTGSAPAPSKLAPAKLPVEPTRKNRYQT